MVARRAFQGNRQPDHRRRARGLRGAALGRREGTAVPVVALPGRLALAPAPLAQLLQPLRGAVAAVRHVLVQQLLGVLLVRAQGAPTGSTARAARPRPAPRPSGSPATRRCRRCPAGPRGRTACGPCPRCGARTSRPGGGNRGSCRARCARSRCAGIPSVTAGTARERPRRASDRKMLGKYSVSARRGSTRRHRGLQRAGSSAASTMPGVSSSGRITGSFPPAG